MDNIVWVNTLFDATEPIAVAMTNVTEYNYKVDSLRTILENTMESLFTYEGFRNKINKTYEGITHRCSEISQLNADITKSMDKGSKMNEESIGFVIDSENNFLVSWIIITQLFYSF